MEQAQRVMEAIDQIVETNELLAKASVGMLIDTVCAKYGGDPVEFAEEMVELVKQVNGALGEIEV